MEHTIYELINRIEKKLIHADNPVFDLANFYCELNGIKQFKELYSAIGKLTKQYGIGVIYQAIIQNFYKNKKYTKENFYKDILFTAIGIKKATKLANEEVTPITYKEYIKLRESVNV